MTPLEIAAVIHGLCAAYTLGRLRGYTDHAKPDERAPFRMRLLTSLFWPIMFFVWFWPASPNQEDV